MDLHGLVDTNTPVVMLLLTSTTDGIDKIQHLNIALAFHSSGCQFVAQLAYFMVVWSETDIVMLSDESFVVE